MAILTKGPQDAQEWIVERLGLAEMADYLATSNALRVSRIEELFKMVLEKLDIGAEEMAFVGTAGREMWRLRMSVGFWLVHFVDNKGEIS